MGSILGSAFCNDYEEGFYAQDPILDLVATPSAPYGDENGGAVSQQLYLFAEHLHCVTTCGIQGPYYKCYTPVEDAQGDAPQDGDGDGFWDREATACYYDTPYGDHEQRFESRASGKQWGLALIGDAYASFGDCAPE